MGLAYIAQAVDPIAREYMTLSRDQITRSKAIQRRTGTTFHLATRLLPERIRHPTYVLYGLFRLADDVVDTENPPPEDELRARLSSMRAAAIGDREADDPVVAAFAALQERHDIPREEAALFFDSMEMDVDTDRYETHSELQRYLRGSAAAVGQMMLEVMDPPEKEAARRHASALGDALQLTNFLRDVREDVLELDRIYLPEATLAEYGVSHEDVEALRFSDGMAAAIETELRRAERWYHEGVSGIEYLPADTQFAVLASAVMYADYHRQIREMGYDVLTQEPELSIPRRLRLLGRTWLAWQFSEDPVSVFYKVTDLEPPAVAIDDESESESVTESTSDEPEGEGVVATLRSSVEWTTDTLAVGPIRGRS